MHTRQTYSGTAAEAGRQERDCDPVPFQHCHVGHRTLSLSRDSTDQGTKQESER